MNVFTEITSLENLRICVKISQIRSEEVWNKQTDVKVSNYVIINYGQNVQCQSYKFIVQLGKKLCYCSHGRPAISTLSGLLISKSKHTILPITEATESYYDAQKPTDSQISQPYVKD